MKWLLIINIILLPFCLNAQGVQCNEIEPLCFESDTTLELLIGTNDEPSNNYDCLIAYSSPNWFYFKVDNSGSLELEMDSELDADFIIWGPFEHKDSATAYCDSLGVSSEAPVVDCSYDAGTVDTLTVPGAIAGEIYVLMITNYAGSAQNATLSQISGTASTDCSIVPFPSANIVESEETPMQIIPNPVSDIASFGTTEIELEYIEIFDTRGKLVSSKKPIDNVVNVSDLISGIYFVKARTKSNETFVLKMIKN